MLNVISMVAKVMKIASIKRIIRKRGYPVIGLIAGLSILGVTISLLNNNKPFDKPPEKMTGVPYSDDTVLYFRATAGNVLAGDTLNVAVRVNSNESPVNAVRAAIVYPDSKLEYMRVDSTGSTFDVEASASGGGGKVQFARGKINGASGDQLVATVVFRVRKESSGTATVSFSSDSNVLDASTNQDILARGVNSMFNILNSTATNSDTTSPSAPSGLKVEDNDRKGKRLSWDVARDDQGIGGYKIFRNGLLIASTSDPRFTDSFPNDGKTYSYKISAFDTNDNDSAFSADVQTN